MAAAEMLTPTTELEAINVMLHTIGEAPVNTLTGELNYEVSIAVSTLAEVSRDIQTYGWKFNRNPRYRLMPDENGELRLPTNALAIATHPDYRSRYDLVSRGDKVISYSETDGEVTKFTEPVDCILVICLPFEQLPESARRYILIRAARLFQDRVARSSEGHAYSETDEFFAMLKFRREHAVQSRMSYIHMFRVDTGKYYSYGEI